jgi:poly(3-hydroxyalkanoate) synthetase
MTARELAEKTWKLWSDYYKDGELGSKEILDIIEKDIKALTIPEVVKSFPSKEDYILWNAPENAKKYVESTNHTRNSLQLRHEDFTIGEKVWMTTKKIVVIDTFCEDGTILVEDDLKYYKANKQDLNKVV